MACVFCEIGQDLAPASVVYRDTVSLAFMDIQPVNPGHVLVVPVEHSTSLGELCPEVGAHLFRVAQRISGAIRKSDLRAEGINLFLADGEAAGQEVLHVHLHVLPRFAGDGFGLHFGPNYTDRPDRRALDSVAEQLASTLLSERSG